MRDHHNGLKRKLMEESSGLGESPSKTCHSDTCHFDTFDTFDTRTEDESEEESLDDEEELDTQKVCTIIFIILQRDFDVFSRLPSDTNQISR